MPVTANDFGNPSFNRLLLRSAWNLADPFDAGWRVQLGDRLELLEGVDVIQGSDLLPRQLSVRAVVWNNNMP